MEAPKVPKLRLVIPGKKASTANAELISSLPQVSMISVDTCIHKAVQWTFRQLESFHELLPRMGDVERRHSLALLARQCHSLWKEVKTLCELSDHSMEKITLALRGTEYLKREEENRANTVQELEYQNYVMPSCALPAQPSRLLLKIQSHDPSFAFPWDITRFISTTNSLSSMSLFIRKQTFKFLSQYFPHCASVTRISEEVLEIKALGEFILEFTIASPATADNEEGFSWFLLKASLQDPKLAAQVGNSLTGMLQHRPLSVIKRDLEVYRSFCFLQQIYLQFQEARKNVELAIESGSGTLYVTLWGNSRNVFEVKIHQDTGMIELTNIPDQDVKASPQSDFVETLIDNAALAKFRKFATKIKSWASQSYSIQEGNTTLSISSQKIENVQLNFWLNRRTGKVHGDHPKVKIVEDDVSLQFIAQYFNQRILNGLVQGRTETPMLIIKSELNKWNLRDARLFMLKEDEDLAVALALTLHPINQTLREQLVMLIKDSLGIIRISETRELSSSATVSAAEEYILDYRFNELGICVDTLSGEIVNACLTPGIVRLLLLPNAHQIIVERDQNKNTTVTFEKWQDIPRLISEIVTNCQ